MYSNCNVKQNLWSPIAIAFVCCIANRVVGDAMRRERCIFTSPLSFIAKCVSLMRCLLETISPRTIRLVLHLYCLNMFATPLLKSVLVHLQPRLSNLASYFHFGSRHAKFRTKNSHSMTPAEQPRQALILRTDRWDWMVSETKWFALHLSISVIGVATRKLATPLFTAGTTKMCNCTECQKHSVQPKKHSG
jgi:hypothetical protein